MLDFFVRHDLRRVYGCVFQFVLPVPAALLILYLLSLDILKPCAKMRLFSVLFFLLALLR